MRRYVKGHRLNGLFYQWFHLCPGVGCAIQAWLANQARRHRYERSSDLTQ
jgi:hypothetical protein